MHKLGKGDYVGIRGPFGKPFPVKVMVGNDLLFVAGGLGVAPLRSLINYVMDNRKEFGKVDILLGCRTPQDMLFGDEIPKWQKRLDVNFNCTVDRGAPDRTGNVGQITTQIPGVTIIPAALCRRGSTAHHVKFVINELLNKDLPKDRSSVPGKTLEVRHWVSAPLPD